MSFSVAPKASPSVPFLDKSPSSSEAARQSRERAISAFMGGSQQQDASTPPNTRQAAPQAPDAAEFALAQAAAKAREAANTNPPVPENTQESGQVDNTEVATSQPAKVESETPLSQHYAVLARKEQSLRAEVKRLNAERAAFKAEREAAKATPAAAAAPAAPQAPSSIAKDRLLNDPVGVFEELGISTEDLANKLLNYQPADSRLTAYVSKLEEKIAKLESGQDEIRKSSEAQQSHSYEQALNQIRFEAEELVNSDPEFATIKTTGQAEEVVTVIKEIFEKGLEGRYKAGTLLTVEAAARLVEDELVNQWIEQHEKLSNVDKIKKRLAAKTPVATPGTTPPNGQAPTQQGQKTLSNSMTSGGKKLSARERAIAVFKGEQVG